MEAVVLFGAGASLDRQGADPSPPPRGSELFNQLAELFPSEWGQLPPNLHEQFLMGDFEVGMDALLKSSDEDVFVACMQRMSEYFASFTISLDNSHLYSRFIHALGRRNLLGTTLLSTLNYECMLEEATSNWGLYTLHGFEPIENPFTVRVIKLHGSATFFPPKHTEGVQMSGNTYINLPMNRRLSTDGKMIYVSPEDVASRIRKFPSFYAEMCMYARGKEASTSSGEIRKLQAEWTRRVLRARLVVVIGVSFQRHDQHIWGPLTETRAPVVFVGNRDSFSKWTSEANKNEGDRFYLSNRFSTALASIADILTYATFGGSHAIRRFPISLVLDSLPKMEQLARLGVRPAQIRSGQPIEIL